jgi:hypothetical protein
MGIATFRRKRAVAFAALAFLRTEDAHHRQQLTTKRFVFTWRRGNDLTNALASSSDEGQSAFVRS